MASAPREKFSKDKPMYSRLANWNVDFKVSIAE